MTPKRSDGNQDIVITGRAVERSSGLPMAGVPLNLVITLQGFERKYQVITGDDGSFSHTFTPLSGEAGVYAVRAVHPDRTDRPVQATFTINRVHVSPSSIKLNIPRNYEKTIKVNGRRAPERGITGGFSGSAEERQASLYHMGG
ncbi:MAG: hypothetical protein JRI90_13955 [Deltaproteobacteria bacterium]|nr:hypothetical protein [Deltaproteobacteria bacterium]